MRRALVQRPDYKWWVFGAVGFGTFISVVDHGSLNVALPTIAAHFDTDFPTVQWVVVGYSLTISVLLLPMGRLSDIIGRKQVYIFGFVLFVIGAFLAATSSHIVTLILSRVLQGCGAAMTQGTGMAITASAFPQEQRGKALGPLTTQDLELRLRDRDTAPGLLQGPPAEPYPCSSPTSIPSV